MIRPRPSAHLTRKPSDKRKRAKGAGQILSSRTDAELRKLRSAPSCQQMIDKGY